MNSSRRPVPAAHHVVGIAQCANPDIAARIFIDAKYLIRGKAVPGSVNRFRMCVGDLSEICQLGVANEPLAGAHAPRAGVVLENYLIPAPAPIRNPRGQCQRHGNKSSPIELADDKVWKTVAKNAQLM